MKVLFFSIEDWANVGQTYARALKSVGVNAKAFTMKTADFKYPDKEESYSNFNRLRDVITGSDVIVLMHTHPDHVKIPFNLSEKRVAVFHGGSQYRDNPEMMNAIFNPLVYTSLIQTGDLLDKGAKNQKWVQAAVDTDRIRPRKIKSNNPSKLVFSHYPRHPLVKGTALIENAMQRIKRKCGKNVVYYSDQTIFPWKKNLDRVAKCDIYIDAMQMKLGDKAYGEWGIQTLEAAALGKIVVAHFGSKDRYEKEIGPCPIVSVNNEKELYEKLLGLAKTPHEEIKKLQKETRDWVVKYHSLKPMGKRLKEALELTDEG